MKKQMICGAFAVLALTAPAVAQGYGMLPPYEVATILRSAGLDPVGPPRLQGPNYVVRAFDRRDREVRVIVNAQSGSIVAVRPFDVATRAAPPPYGAYERAQPGYAPPNAYRGGYAPRPDVDDDDDDAPPPRGYSARPPSAAPGNLPRSSNAAPPPRGYGRPDNDDDDDLNASPPSAPNVIRADPDRSGALPPPPERFPQRVGPQTEKSKPPVKRAAAAAGPKPAPLPKPKPTVNTSAPAPTPAAKPGAKFDEPPAPAPAPAQVAPAPAAPVESPPDQTSPREPATAVPN